MDSQVSLLTQGMTLRQIKFCEVLAITLDQNKALEESGLAKASSGRLMAMESVQNYLVYLRQEQKAKMGISQDRVLQELARMAYVDIAELYDENGCVRNIRDLPEDLRRAISSVETEEIFEQDGRKKRYVGDSKKVKFGPKEKALEMLGRHLGLFEKDNKQNQTNIIIVTGEESTKIWQSLQDEF